MFPCGVAQGDLLMLMGTAEAVAEGPSKPVLFEEDLTDAQKSRLSDSGMWKGYEGSVGVWAC